MNSCAEILGRRLQVAPGVTVAQFDELVRITSGRVIRCSVIVRCREGFLAVEHIEALAPVVANGRTIVFQGQDVMGRVAPEELARLARIAERSNQ